MKHIVSVSEKFLIVSLRIFCLTSAVCNRLLGGELWAFGFRLTQFEICERLTTNSQSKNLLFVHKVTAFDDAVVGSSKHLKTAVSVDSAQVFRCYKTARINICKVDYVDNAALALFAFAERVVCFFDNDFHPIGTKE